MTDSRNRLVLNTALLLFVMALPLVALGAVEWRLEQLRPESVYEYDFATKTFVATNGVMIIYGDAVLTAERASANSETGEVVADGNVRVQQGDQTWAS